MNRSNSSAWFVTRPADLTSLQSDSLERVVKFDLASLHQLNPERYPFLLESVAQGGLGQFDILLAYPQHTLQLNDIAQAQSFVAAFEQEWLEQSIGAQQRAEYQQAVKNQLGDLPFHGGWFAYFSYDYAQVVEPVLDLPRSDLPLAHLSRIPCAIIIDHRSGQMTLIAETQFAHALDEMQADLTMVLAKELTHATAANSPNVQSQSEEPEDKYLLGVQAIKEYILAGDVFQVNLSRQWTVNLAPQTSYLAVYHALRHNNPAPFAALVSLKDAQNRPWQIISSSPERLVKYQAPWVETRPIAGTRKRSTQAQADLELIAELISHPKERAEHIMLIDLERNDLGRICLPGTVQVNELMVVETYQHVHHIVSNVRGQPQAGLTPLDIVHALFPGGTITGCPKIRCMQIIAELEKMPRDAYTGSLGYINRDGSMDLNILIRTMMTRRSEQALVVQFRAGAGIVADSVAHSELTETRHKAKGLVNALSVDAAL